MLPCSEWGSDSGFYIVTVPIDSNFSFEMKSINATKGEEYCIQLVLEDVSGEQYASEVIPLAYLSESHKVKQNTDFGTITYEVYEDHAEVAEYIGNDTHLEVPEAIEGVPVTVIRRSAFSKIHIGSVNGRNTFQKVILPDSVEMIEADAFRFCTDMTEIHLPASLKIIGDCAFAECRSLEHVQLPEHLEIIGKGAFAYCNSLEEIKLPESLTSIGEGIFLGCERLMSISTSAAGEGEHYHVVDQTLLLRGDQKTVLASACGKSGEVTIPDGVTTIAYGAFCRSSLEKVIFPEGLTEIDNFAFYMTKSLQVPVFPSTLKRIGTHAFGTCDTGIGEDQIPSERQEIYIGESVTKIEKGAFNEFPTRWFTVSEKNPSYSAVDGAICNKANDYLVYFAGAEKDTFVVPNGVVNLDMSTLEMIGCYSAFDNALAKFQLIIPASVTALLNEDSFLSNWRISMIHCAPGSVAEKYAKENDIRYDYVFSTEYEEYVESTPHGKAMYRVYEDHASLVQYEGTDRTLTIASSVQGKTVTAIGDGVNCIQEHDYGFGSLDLSDDESEVLQSVVIPEGVTTINAKAMDAMYLEEISLPDTLKVIGDHALSLSNGAKLPKLPDSVEYVGEQFLTCSTGEEFYIPSSLGDADAKAFEGMKKITAYVVGEGNTRFSENDGVLLDADGTTLISYPDGRRNEDGFMSIPEGITKVGEYAFYSSWELTSVEIPEGVTEIGAYAFASCSNLTSVKLPESLINIDDRAFYFCSNLTEINLPGNVKRIGESAFLHCEGLETVDFPDGLISLGDDAFYGCVDLQVSGLPDSLAVIGDRVFGTYDEIEELSITVSLSLGPNLRSIGKEAFKYLGVTSFEVDDENPYYSAFDGFLTDPSKTVLLICPSGLGGSITIPSTITRIADGAFKDVNRMTDLTIPDSVTHISDSAFAYEYVTETIENEDGTTQDSYGVHYNFTIHCSEGSYAEKYAIDNNIPYVLE